VSYPPDRTLDGRHEAPREERRPGYPMSYPLDRTLDGRREVPREEGDQATADARWRPGPAKLRRGGAAHLSTDMVTATVPFSPIRLCLSFFSNPTLGFLLLVHVPCTLGAIYKSSGTPVPAPPGSQILPFSSTTTVLLVYSLRAPVSS
jgi:hypothetical protein